MSLSVSGMMRIAASIAVTACVIALYLSESFAFVDRDAMNGQLYLVKLFGGLAAVLLAVRLIAVKSYFLVGFFALFASLIFLSYANSLVLSSSLRAFLEENKYVSLQSGASEFIKRISNSNVFYYGDKNYYRLLTDKPFLGAANLRVFVADAGAGLPQNMTEEQYAKLQDKEWISFWYGGYHFAMNVSGPAKDSKNYFFVLPPGEFRNLVLIVPLEIFQTL